MMSDRFFVCSLIFFSIFLLSISVAGLGYNGYVESDADLLDWYGPKGQYAATSLTLNAAGSYAGNVVRCPVTDAGAAGNKIVFRTGTVAGAWAGLSLYAGVWSVTSNGDINAEIGSVAFTPVSNTLFDLALNVALSSDTFYFIGVRDKDNRLSSSLTCALSVMTVEDVFSRVNSRTGNIEPNDYFLGKIGASYSTSQTLMSISYLMVTSDISLGCPYYQVYTYSLYTNTRSVCVEFTPYKDFTGDRVGVWLRGTQTKSTAFAPVYLYVEYAGNNTRIDKVVLTGTQIGYKSNGGTLLIVNLTVPVAFDDAVSYRLKLVSNSANTAVYAVYYGSVRGSGDSCMFKGMSNTKTSTNNGTGWSSYSYYSLPFMIHEYTACNVVSDDYIFLVIGLLLGCGVGLFIIKDSFL